MAIKSVWTSLGLHSNLYFICSFIWIVSWFEFLPALPFVWLFLDNFFDLKKCEWVAAPARNDNDTNNDNSNVNANDNDNDKADPGWGHHLAPSQQLSSHFMRPTEFGCCIILKNNNNENRKTLRVGKSHSPFSPLHVTHIVARDTHAVQSTWI